MRELIIVALAIECIIQRWLVIKSCNAHVFFIAAVAECRTQKRHSDRLVTQSMPMVNQFHAHTDTDHSREKKRKSIFWRNSRAWSTFLLIWRQRRQRQTASITTMTVTTTVAHGLAYWDHRLNVQLDLNTLQLAWCDNCYDLSFLLFAMHECKITCNVCVLLSLLRSPNSKMVT